MARDEPLIEEISRFLDKHQLSESAFGVAATGNQRLVERVRRGTATLQSADRAREFMRTYKPKVIANGKKAQA